MTDQQTPDQDVPSNETSQDPTSLPPQEAASPESAPSSPQPEVAESPTLRLNPAPPVETRIPEGLDNEAAGSQTVNRWLIAQFGKTLTQMQQRHPEAKTLRQIVWALENEGMPLPQMGHVTAEETEAEKEPVTTDQPPEQPVTTEPAPADPKDEGGDVPPMESGATGQESPASSGAADEGLPFGDHVHRHEEPTLHNSTHGGHVAEHRHPPEAFL